MLYDERYHLHVGYYDNGFDLEAVALKRQLEEVWDIFFDFEGYRLVSPIQEDKIMLNGFGIRIISIAADELDYQQAAHDFEQWLSNQGLIRSDESKRNP